MRRVLVVGAGVIGLSCAVRLLEAGHRVDVLARDLPLETTSAVAAAIWSPHVTAQEHALRWARRTYDDLAVLAGDDATGVVLRAGEWRGPVPDGWGTDWTSSAPVVEMPLYLRWLTARVKALGGTITRLNLSALPGGEALVVDAAGLGAKHLGADPTVRPVRGQVILAEQVGLDRWAVDSTSHTYVIPRSRDIVLGGTAEVDVWSRTPDPAAAADILARATALVPALAGARVLRHKVGLRPDRPSVRLERVGDVIHCYGHGGAGVTLSWGCAADVVRLASGVEPGE